jgi:hypothetical protein
MHENDHQIKISAAPSEVQSSEKSWVPGHKLRPYMTLGLSDAELCRWHAATYAGTII